MLELFSSFSGGCIITFIYCVIVLSLLEVLMGCHRPLSGLWYIFQSSLSPVCSKFILHTMAFVPWAIVIRVRAYSYAPEHSFESQFYKYVAHMGIFSHLELPILLQIIRPCDNSYPWIGEKKCKKAGEFVWKKNRIWQGILKGLTNDCYILVAISYHWSLS